MQVRSLHDTLRSTLSLPPAAYTDGTVNGASADGYDSDSVEFEVFVGTWTDGVHTFSFEDSPDDAAWTAVVAANLDGRNSTDLTGATVVVSDATKDDSVVQVGYIGGEQYVRAVLVTTGSTTGAVAGAAIHEGRLRSRGKTPMSAPAW